MYIDYSLLIMMLGDIYLFVCVVLPIPILIAQAVVRRVSK